MNYFLYAIALFLEVCGVEDCVVYVAANAIMGQTVVAHVDRKASKKEIRKYCNAKLDRYKVPTKINFSLDTGISNRTKKIRIDKYT